MTPQETQKQLLLRAIAERLMIGVYDGIESQLGITTSEALSQYLIATDIHCELQNMIQTGQIRTEQALVQYLDSHFTDYLDIKFGFEGGLIRPVGCS